MRRKDNMSTGALLNPLSFAIETTRRCVVSKGDIKGHHVAKRALSIVLTDESAHRTFEMLARRLSLDVGTGQRILRVARTIASLDFSPVIKGIHVAEAAQYRLVKGVTYE